MLNILEHTVFEKEHKAVAAKFHCAKDFEHLKKILAVQFDPIRPIPVIGPGKIHRVKEFADCALWKVEMSVKGLRQNQSPRIWFAVKGDTIAFLSIRSHVDSYDNNTVDTIAEQLISDLF